jgi:hypothetical protein
VRRFVALLVAGLLATSWLAPPAGAQWASSSTGSAIARAVPNLLPPASLTATCASPLLGQPRVTLTWPPSATPGTTQYEVRFGTSSLGAPQIVTETTFVTGNLGTGTWNFAVRTAAGTWRSSAVTATATVISIVFVGVACG